MSEDIQHTNNTSKTGPKGPSKPLNNEDFQRLLNMVRIQCTLQECCSILGMSDTTLNRRLKERGEDNFEALYRRYNDEGRMSLRRMQWQAAENGNASLLIWLGKQYLNQRDKSNLEVTGEDGGAIITKIERVIVDPTDTNS
jgi:AraC-like DNA-binding protein